MKQQFLIVIIFITTFFYGKAQLLTYDIVTNEKIIGNLTVLIKENGATTTYEVESKVKLPFNISYSYTLHSTYRNNILISSTVKSYMNNSLHRLVTTQKQENGYEVNIEGKKQFIHENIHYAEALIYVLEPVNQSQLYSDFSGSYKSIKSLGYHKYKMTNLDNGNISTYKYKNGKLSSAEIDYGALNFFIIKK